MPHTIAHLGVNALATKSILRNADFKWILLAAVIPDVPFIIKRAVGVMLPGADQLDVRMYAIVQASLLVSLLLSFAASRFSTRSTTVFGILALGIGLHLLLDSLQVKWGNGVLLLAPFDWRLTNFGWFWPEQWPTHLLAATGVIALVFAFRRSAKSESADLALPSRKTVAIIAFTFAIYLLLPWSFMASAEQAGRGQVELIRLQDRSGQAVQLDRARFRNGEGVQLVEIFRGTFIVMSGIEEKLPSSGKVSIRGHFRNHSEIVVDEYHLNAARSRELLSIFGLLVIAMYWLRVLLYWKRADFNRG